MSPATRITTLAIVMLAMLTAPSTRAAEVGSESLGDSLLEGLDPQPFAPPPGEATPARPDFQKRILPSVTDDRLGEDLGQPSSGGSLAAVERKMGLAADLLREAKESGRASDVQQEVVNDLDALIEQLAKQCGGACQSSGEPKPASQRSQASQPKPAGTPSRSASSARDSVSQLRPGNPGAVNLADRKELLKDLWGHLPPQVREQLLQSYSDEFLPQYELEIEKYFRRLAEEQAHGQ